MTKTAGDNDQVTQRTSTAGALTRGQRRRGRGKGELVPMLERLRPRQVKGIKVTGKELAKPPSSRQKSSQRRISSGDSSSRNTVSESEQGGKRKVVKTCVNSLGLESSKGEERSTTDNKSGMPRKVMEETEGEKEAECAEGVSEERGEGKCVELLLPPVPKLRRMHAVTLPSHCEMDEHQKESQTDLPHPSSASRDYSTLSTSSTDACPTRESSDEHLRTCTYTPASEPVHIPSSGIVTKRIQRKRGRQRRAPITPNTSSLPESSLDTIPTPHTVLSTCSIAATATTLGEITPPNNLNPKGIDGFSASVTTSHAVSMAHSNSLISSVDVVAGSEGMIFDTDDSPDLSEYPQPSTNYQKMQRQLARQKQLEDMRARESAEAREERFLRRQGLSKSPEKKQGRRHLTWKEEPDLVEVFVYSPCSSRGSTLEPELDDIPDFS